MNASFAGKDYPEGQVSPHNPDPFNWYDLPTSYLKE